MKLIFATNNAHKVEEIRAAVGSRFEILSLKEAGIDIDIPEPYDTLEENATAKSKTIYQLALKNLNALGCFSEDTGLEVEALHGEPGVRSARYAGDSKNFDDNINKLLQNLQLHANRKAKFRTVISLQLENKEYLFEGICEGIILNVRRGGKGFGYDSIFLPNGAGKTFAEMSIEEKNSYSHRKKAADKLVAFLAGWADLKNNKQTSEI
ncbi:MAG: non-canonical purine NTP pyrophosphatase, RdgB/HAM1 family [Chitinophagaceae bacterium]